MIIRVTMAIIDQLLQVLARAWSTTSIALLAFLLSTGAHAQTTVEYIHTDALGSPVAVSNASGNVIEREVYEPYGSPITRPPSDQPGFTGHVADSLTGLTYMQQRYYDPQVGRFLSVDPVTAHSNPIGAFNRYWYANNNPYKFTDPDGRLPVGDPNPSSYMTAEDSARFLNMVADGLEAVDQFFMGFPPQISGPERMVGLPIIAVARGLAGEAKAVSALTRAKEVQSVLSPRTQRAVTTAVVETKEGARVFSSSEGALRPAARAALQEGEIAVKGARGTHAEVNAVRGAREAGLTPVSVSPSRPACSGCQQAMKNEDIPIIDR